jgi:serine/threonine-protein phosphatase PP1 catalytic subunit
MAAIDAVIDRALKSPSIELYNHRCRFHLKSVESDRSNLFLELEIVSALTGPIDILISVIIVHPDGPTRSLSLPLTGTLSRGNRVLQLAIPESISSLHTKGFLWEGRQIKMKFSITLPARLTPSFAPDVGELIERILRPHNYFDVCPISQTEVNWLTVRASQIFHEQAMLLQLSTPLIVVGDLHGNYFDLMRIFMRYGFPDVANYLFLGDLVDRGKNGVDIVLLICCFKIMCPENVFLIRGNHESERVSSAYGFKDECTRKNVDYDLFLPLFNSLPLAAVVGEKIFCVHAGISPTLTSLRQIETFETPAEVPTFGTMHDLLWSDPRADIEYVCFNERRGTSYQFGPKALAKFLTDFNFELLVRAHEVVRDGYAWPFERSVPIITIFSATENEGHNAASVLLINEQLTCAIDTFRTMTKAEKKEMRYVDFNEYRMPTDPGETVALNV